MSLQHFLRAPFAAASQANSYSFQLIEEFGTAGMFSVQVLQTGVGNIILQPVFPGKLTFKPSADQVIPADASGLTAPLLGDLYLECTTADIVDWIGAQIPGYNFPLVFAYYNVFLGPDFFAQLTSKTAKLKFDSLTLERFTVDTQKKTDPATRRAQATLDFASGTLSVNLPPESLAAGDLPWFASMLATPGTPTAAQFAVGVRINADPYVRPPGLAQLQSAEISDAAHLAPLPLTFLFNQLKASSGWANGVAQTHANHPFFTYLGTLEDPAQLGRWRAVRCRPLFGSPADSANVKAALLGATIRGLDSSLTELWHASTNAIADAFIKRPDGELFRIKVEFETVAVPIAPDGSTSANVTVLDSQWVAASRTSQNRTLALIVDTPLDPSLLSNPMPEMGINAVDRGGHTIDEVERAVLDTREWVRFVRTKLVELGFALARPPNHGEVKFDIVTSWAVRELQLHAAMGVVATETLQAPVYTDRLAAVANDQPYTGKISGIMDTATGATFRFWLQNKYRCPVVIETWKVDSHGVRVSRAVANVWQPSDDSDRTHHAFARDFSEYYTLPPNRVGDSLVPVGARHGIGVESGLATHTSWSDITVSPERLLGLPAPNSTPNDPTFSTYKVVRGVAQAETLGVFDAINGFDFKVLSMGVYHWTITNDSKAVPDADATSSSSELPAYFAYLKRVEPDTFKSFLAAFGVDVAKDWKDATALYTRDLVNWNTDIKMAGLQRKRTGKLNIVDPTGAPLRIALEGEWFRTWHWLYRFVMMCRTNTAFQRRQWDMARLRIKALLAVPWDAPHPIFGPHATLGQIFSSERAVTALTRAHVLAPAAVIHVVNKGTQKKPRRVTVVSDLVRNAYINTHLASDDPTKWTQPEIDRLNKSLEDALIGYTTNMADSMPLALADTPFGPLATQPGTFLFDPTNLPV